MDIQQVPKPRNRFDPSSFSGDDMAMLNKRMEIAKEQGIVPGGMHFDSEHYGSNTRSLSDERTPIAPDRESRPKLQRPITTFH
jgi:hypothetical protein